MGNWDIAIRRDAVEQSRYLAKAHRWKKKEGKKEENPFCLTTVRGGIY